MKKALSDIIESASFKRLCLAGAAIAVIAGIFFAYVSVESNRVRTFEYKNSGMNTKQSGLVMKMVVPDDKLWKDGSHFPGKPVGAQYEFYLSNSADAKLKDWSVRIDFNEEPEMDSSWNGDFEVVGKTIFFDPDKFTESFRDGDPTYFGAVLYSEDKLNMTGYSITCRLQPDVLKMPFFYVLVFLIFIWIITFLAYLVSFAKVERIQYLRKRDALMIEQSIRTFTSFIDAKDTYTRGHSVRVAIYARELGRRAGLDGEELNTLYYETLLHDVGKISIPDSILQKPGVLTPEEYEIIKGHPTRGSEMLKAFTAIPNIRDGAHYHHERFDGKGYPDGLAGEEIPLHARIICVADSFDAMSSLRSYRAPYDNNRIIEELESNSGTQFDPDFIPYMVEMIQDGFTDRIRYEYGADGGRSLADEQK
ncbi:MAG: HD domain-containing protein [Lachnospiraceae bacterium]|nr:HD domain-containing protein [Lachnospiraceae bacterium]